MSSQEFKLYRHYKNKIYRYFSLVKHSETLEDFVLYKPLENNPEGQLWIRPKDMFFEEINVNGQQIPRFSPIDFKYTILNQIEPIILEHLNTFTKTIIIDFDEDYFAMNLKDKKNILLQMATDPSLESEINIVGFQIGFEQNIDTYISLIKIITPGIRSLDIDHEFSRQQQFWCEKIGYKFLTTKLRTD